MTISTTNTKITYQANGSTTAWSFTFPGGPNPDIHVFVTNPSGVITEITTNLQVNVNAPIAPNPTSIGGSVVYPVSGAPLAVGNQITIIREVPLTQPTSLANQAILYQEVIEKALDYIVEEVQQLQEQIDRQFLLPIDEEGPLILPGCPERANKFLAFDEDCNPIAVGNSNPITSTNGIRVPNTETIPELPARPLRPGAFISFDGNGDPILAALPPPNLQPLLGQRVTLTAAHTVLNTEKGFLLQLTGSTYYDLSFGDPTTYDADFSIAVFNADVYTGPGSGRAKRIMFNGVMAPGGLLWPGQWIYVFRYGSTWVANPRDIRWKPGVSVTIYVDPVLGSDLGAADGLATGAGAFKTVANAVAGITDRIDWGGILIAGAGTVQLAAGTYTEAIYVGFPTVGGNPVIIKGADDGVDPTPWLIQVAGSTYGIQADMSANVNVKGLTFKSIGADAIGVVSSRGSTININNCKFQAFTGAKGYQLHAFDSANLFCRDIFIAGSCNIAFLIRRQSTLNMSGALTTSGGLNFAQSFVYITYGSSMMGGAKAVGDSTDFHLVGGAGCTGIKYIVAANSTIAVGTGNIANFPGNSAGLVGATPTLGIDASNVYD